MSKFYHTFSHFKQLYTYFNTLFHLHVYKKHSNFSIKRAQKYTISLKILVTISVLPEFSYKKKKKKSYFIKFSQNK